MLDRAKQRKETVVRMVKSLKQGKVLCIFVNIY